MERHKVGKRWRNISFIKIEIYKGWMRWRVIKFKQEGEI